MPHRLRVPVLIVDDEPEVLAVLAAMVAHNGCAPVTAESGARAVERHRAMGGKIGLAMVSVQMREMDGPVTLVALRETDPDLPCIFVNGDGGRYSTAALLDFGAVAVLNKPNVLKGLKPALAAALAQRAGAAAPNLTSTSSAPTGQEPVTPILVPGE
ncbi:histidine kinase : Two component, sigma54 specific, transcriptional regulator, Fis family OS=candidate division ZIXI bacterium RBG-1 GN=RBG1_1C00001G1280 PE=4 SV=1: Response_reg [Gemmata massiliana]|uniref:Response regulatory domain-containing protein n=1 Tax=Gemmata massiliana TaxID=1210884 RepID=A0A6P2CWF2_9BACT|nr:response regulator [Gemmata massiliana]VTR93311.1 histidine kinase : Two component, sigma54 specific, transcriptional regulator, Fis family OS=candidate division ZIXI bacterium RBG-1 GN=RBG1_1C00001G1280 PE=4 SV=1: Response_reg [Gemmata massiliana]